MTSADIRFVAGRNTLVIGESTVSRHGPRRRVDHIALAGITRTRAIPVPYAGPVIHLESDGEDLRIELAPYDLSASRIPVALEQRLPELYDAMLQPFLDGERSWNYGDTELRVEDDSLVGIRDQKQELLKRGDLTYLEFSVELNGYIIMHRPDDRLLVRELPADFHLLLYFLRKYFHVDELINMVATKPGPVSQNKKQLARELNQARIDTIPAGTARGLVSHKEIEGTGYNCRYSRWLGWALDLSLWFGACVLFIELAPRAVHSVFCLGMVFLAPGLMWLGGILAELVYRHHWTKKIRRRDNCGLEPASDCLYVGIRPRTMWKSGDAKAADIGYLFLDKERQTIQFEGGKKRLCIPANAIISCTLESAFPRMALIIVAQDKDGRHEWPFMLRLTKSSKKEKKILQPVLETVQGWMQ